MSGSRARVRPVVVAAAALGVGVLLGVAVGLVTGRLRTPDRPGAQR